MTSEFQKVFPEKEGQIRRRTNKQYTGYTFLGG